LCPPPTQVQTISELEIESLQGLVKQIKVNAKDFNLDNGQNADLLAHVGSLDSQLKASKPNKGIIKSCLASLKRIFETITGNVVAAQILTQINSLFP